MASADRERDLMLERDGAAPTRERAADPVVDRAPAAWFLSSAERGNPATAIDRRRAGVAWTRGSHGRLLLDGATYFARLHEELCSTRAGDTVLFTDWEGDADERLADDDHGGEGSEIGSVLADLARRGVQVFGLLWRSHTKAINFSAEANLDLARTVNEAGGEVLLDQRVRRGGSHHQKLVVIRRADAGDARDDVAFVGGIDLCHGRRDDGRHLGDPQAATLKAQNYGEQPPWHDTQLELHGPAIDDIEWTFRERWEDPNPLDTRNPWRAVWHRRALRPTNPTPLPRPVTRDGDGPLAVQMLRTYPSRRRRYPFAPDGERSIARAYGKAFRRARRVLYLEDQYLWSFDAAEQLTLALRREPELRVVIVIPRFPDPDGYFAGNASHIGREYVLDALSAAGDGRVAVYDLENHDGVPIYVHSKVCVIDDLWLAVGSDNLNRRSWTHDSEISCAVIDSRRDQREPRDPAGRGEGARRIARDARVSLSAEHLGRSPDDTDDLVDPDSWFDAMRDSAHALDDWHAAGRRGPRPAGHLRVHPVERVRGFHRLGHQLIHRVFLDPDGRPTAMRRASEF
ncbi:MAG: phospholipase D-like domain-containing protein [Acidimicrobiia bacterium]